MLTQSLVIAVYICMQIITLTTHVILSTLVTLCLLNTLLTLATHPDVRYVIIILLSLFIMPDDFTK